MTLPASPKSQRIVAVFLNAHAGRVTPQIVRDLKALVGEDHVFLSHSEEHGAELLRELVELGYSAIFAGGGDGTIIQTFNVLQHIHQETRQPLPQLGVLRLGTGNALARYLGAASPEEDLRSFRSGKGITPVSVSMVESEGRVFPFAGMGTDAAVLSDYTKLRARLKGTLLEPLGYGLIGYLIAGFLKTVPHYLFRPRDRIRVLSLGSRAWRLAPGGSLQSACLPAGTVLYDGPCSWVGMASTPLLGYGVRMFPYAESVPGCFQLRVLNMSSLESGLYFPAAARGTLRHPRCHDFMVERVRLIMEQTMPYQVGGDAMGYRQELSCQLSKQPVSFLRRA